MRRIIKFGLVPEITTIETADEPRFLAVGAQRGVPVVWCEATVGKGVRTELGSVMTGEAPPPDGEYLGTTQLGREPEIVVHVYRRTPA